MKTTYCGTRGCVNVECPEHINHAPNGIAVTTRPTPDCPNFIPYHVGRELVMKTKAGPVFSEKFHTMDDRYTGVHLYLGDMLVCTLEYDEDIGRATVRVKNIDGKAYPEMEVFKK